jgi:hypothetical protein
LFTTCTSLGLSLMFYLYSIFNDPNPECLSSIAKKILERGERRKHTKILHISLTLISLLFQLVLGAVSKLLWPLVHMWRRMRYLSSLKSGEYKHQSDETWKNIKAVEYGIESSVQLFLQLWLLKPFLLDISVWSTNDVIVSCVTGVANFVTFDTYPACYIEKALGKILLTIISLTLGVSYMKCYKPGQGFNDKPLKTIPILVSILAQTIARTFALKSLILLETPLGKFKFAIFILTHYAAVFTIKILFEITPDTEKQKDFKINKEKLRNLLMFIASGLSSTIVMIHLYKDQPIKKSHFTFLTHTSFFILSLVQNLVLVTLPYLTPHLYPKVDCFSNDSRSIAVGVVVGLWFVGVIAQILHYIWAHEWRRLNGQQQVTGFKPEKNQKRREWTDPQAFWCKKNLSEKAEYTR